MFSGNVWIIIGIITGAIAAFALPYGFHLKGQERKSDPVMEVKIDGDFVSGNKTVIGNQVNVNTSAIEKSDRADKIDVAKLKMNRAFEDFNKAIDEIASNFPRESNKIANFYNAHGVLRSGEHIQKQMDLSVKTKKGLDQHLQDLQRKIENVLIEGLGKTSLQLAGEGFYEQQRLFVQAQSRCRAIYPLLNDNPKSWEMKALNELRLTKDFDVANSTQN